MGIRLRYQRNANSDPPPDLSRREQYRLIIEYNTPRRPPRALERITLKGLSERGAGTANEQRHRSALSHVKRTSQPRHPRTNPRTRRLLSVDRLWRVTSPSALYHRLWPCAFRCAAAAVQVTLSSAIDRWHPCLLALTPAGPARPSAHSTCSVQLSSVCPCAPRKARPWQSP